MRSLNALAWRNLKRHRLRTVLSAVAVALGTGVIIAADIVNRTLLGLEREGLLAFAAEILGFGLTAVGAVILSAAGFLVFNAFAMTITQRRREIGALRSQGMVRRQVMRLVLIEALITVGLGTLLGMVDGPLVGRGLLGLLRTFAGDFLEGTADLRIASLGSFLLAAGLGLGVTLLSTLVPAWQATRVAPLTALRMASPSRGFADSTQFVKTGFLKRGVLGWLVISSLFIYLVIAPPGEWVLPPWDFLLTGLCVLVWLSGLALTLPALIGGVGNRAHLPL